MRVRLYHKLGFEKQISRKWMWHLCHYWKLVINRWPSYLCSFISQPTSNTQTHCALKSHPLKTRAFAFQISFFLNVKEVKTWDQHSQLHLILKEIRPSPNSIFGIHNTLGLKLLASLRMTVSHHREQKVKHNLQDTLDSFSNCRLDIEIKLPFFCITIVKLLAITHERYTKTLRDQNFQVASCI